MTRAVVAVLASAALGATGLAGAQAAAPATAPARPATLSGVSAADLPPATIQPAANGVMGPVQPRRLYDSQTSKALAPGEDRPVCDTTGSVPIDATAVVVNLTAVSPTASGWLTAWPYGQDAPPPVSNLNFAAGTVTSNLAIVQVGATTCIVVRNSSRGSTHILVDFQAYLTAGDATAPGTTQTLYGSRLVDTRHQGAAIPAKGSLDVQVAGRGMVPPTGVDAAWLNCTVTQDAAKGWLTTYPAGSPRPPTSNLNFAAGETRTGLTLAKLGIGGRVTVYNGSSKPVHLVVDASAWVRSGTAASALAGVVPISPVRDFDTRTTQALAPGASAYLNPNVGTPPPRASAAILSVTAVDAVKRGWLTVYGTNAAFPSTSNVNFVPGRATANLVVARLDGAVAIRNGSSAAVDVIVDVVGWVNPENAIAGRVVDEAGQGVANANVYAYDTSYYLGRNQADGSFDLPLPLGVRQVLPCAQAMTTSGFVRPDPDHARGCHPSWSKRSVSTLKLGQRLVGADIPLEPAVTVRGTATDSTGAKLTSGQVTLRRASDNRTFGATYITNGTWGIGNVAEGDYYLSLNNPMSSTTTPYGLSPEWYPDIEPGPATTLTTMAAAGAQAVTFRHDSNPVIDLVAEPRARVAGTLQPAEGSQPLPTSARVEFLRANGSAFGANLTTGGDGAWARTVHPGAVKICGYRTTTSTQACWEGDVPRDQATPITVSPGEERTGIAISLR